MRENHWAVGAVHDFHGRAITGVGTADGHPDALHFRHDLPAEFRQSAIHILTTAAERVVLVVGDQHPAHAEVAVQLHHAQLAVECGSSFNVEKDPETAFQSPQVGGRAQ